MYMYTILCVEDRDENLLVIERVSEVFSAHLIKTHTAEEGIMFAREQQPDLIMMDLGLPGIDGLTAVKMLKDDPLTEHIPVIVVTGSTHVSVQECLDAGAVDHILKPFTLSKLMVVLHKHGL